MEFQLAWEQPTVLHTFLIVSSVQGTYRKRVTEAWPSLRLAESIRLNLLYVCCRSNFSLAYARWLWVNYIAWRLSPGLTAAHLILPQIFCISR